MATANKPKWGWGVGYSTPSGGYQIDYNDQNALNTEIERMNTIIPNRQKQGMDNLDHTKYLNNLKTYVKPPATQNGTTGSTSGGSTNPSPSSFANPNDPNGKYLDQMTTTKQLEQLYGFDYSKGYASKQAQAEAQALRDGIADAQRRNASGKQENLKAIDNNLMNQADAMDRNYFQQALQQTQGQVNNGLNGGVAADQDLRLAMSRQANMGDAYRDANLGIMQENNRFTNADLGYAEQLGTVNQQALAREDSLYNTRLNEALQNAQSVDGMKQNYAQLDQQKQAQSYAQQMQLLQAMEGSRQFDLNFGLQEGELTGNYLPSYMRGNPYNNQFSGANIDGVLSQNGITPGNNNDMNNRYSQMTGLPMDGSVNLFQEVLRQKRIYSDPGSTQHEKDSAAATANELRDMIAAQGVNPDMLGAGVGMGDSMANISKLNPTQSKVAQDAQIALERGALTGNYVDPQESQSLQRLFALKGEVENGKGSADTDRQQANILSQLASTGVDVSKFGPNVSLSQALRNYNALGQQTEEGRQFDNTLNEERYQFDKNMGFNYDELNQNNSQFGAQLGLSYDELGQQNNQFNSQLGFSYDELGQNNNQFNSELGYRYDELGQNNNQFNSELGYKYDELGQNNSQFNSTLQLEQEKETNRVTLENRGLDLDQLAQDAEDTKIRLQMDEVDVNEATQGYAATIAGIKTKEKAFDWIAKNQKDIASKGVNVDDLINVITNKFDGSESAGGTYSTGK